MNAAIRALLGGVAGGFRGYAEQEQLRRDNARDDLRALASLELAQARGAAPRPMVETVMRDNAAMRVAFDPETLREIGVLGAVPERSPDRPAPVVEERPDSGGVAIYKDGAFDRWKVQPPPRERPAAAPRPSLGEVRDQEQMASTVQGLQDAIGAVKSNPDAFGAKNFLPNAIVSRLPMRGGADGNAARGMLEFVVGEIRNDRFGAALSRIEAEKAARILSEPSSTPQQILAQLDVLERAARRRQLNYNAALGPGAAPMTPADGMPRRAAPGDALRALRGGRP